VPSRSNDFSGRAWYKVLRFQSATNGEAFDNFFQVWAARR
jgi:hypothetical protein